MEWRFIPKQITYFITDFFFILCIFIYSTKTGSIVGWLVGWLLRWIHTLLFDDDNFMCLILISFSEFL